MCPYWGHPPPESAEDSLVVKKSSGANPNHGCIMRGTIFQYRQIYINLHMRAQSIVKIKISKNIGDKGNWVGLQWNPAGA